MTTDRPHHNVVRTRTGDQLHTQYLSYSDEGKIWSRNRTTCGARVARIIENDVKVRPGLLCVKCFSALNLNLKDGTAWKAGLNVNLICE